MPRRPKSSCPVLRLTYSSLLRSQAPTFKARSRSPPAKVRETARVGAAVMPFSLAPMKANSSPEGSETGTDRAMEIPWEAWRSMVTLGTTRMSPRAKLCRSQMGAPVPRSSTPSPSCMNTAGTSTPKASQSVMPIDPYRLPASRLVTTENMVAAPVCRSDPINSRGLRE